MRIAYKTLQAARVHNDLRLCDVTSQYFSRHNLPFVAFIVSICYSKVTTHSSIVGDSADRMQAKRHLQR